MLKRIFISTLIFLLGIAAGGYLFTGVQPRSLFNLSGCGKSCLSPSEVLGLLASVGIQKLGGNLPLVVKETDKTIAIQHPFPQARIHYVIIPKVDIKNIGEIGEGDEPYIVDAFKVLNVLIRDNHLQKYKIVTNGPGYQSVAYLHFHLLAN